MQLLAGRPTSELPAIPVAIPMVIPTALPMACSAVELLCLLAGSPTSPLSYQLFPWLFLWLFLWHAAAGWQSYCSVINYSYGYFYSYSYSYTYSYVVSYGTQLLAGSPTYESASRVHSHTCCFKGHVMPSKGLFVFLLALGKHSEKTLEWLINKVRLAQV